MKRKMWMRALALLTATAAIVADSGMVYAAEAVPVQQEVSEEDKLSDAEPEESLESEDGETTETDSGVSEEETDETEEPAGETVATDFLGSDRMERSC